MICRVAKVFAESIQRLVQFLTMSIFILLPQIPKNHCSTNRPNPLTTPPHASGKKRRNFTFIFVVTNKEVTRRFDKNVTLFIKTPKDSVEEQLVELLINHGFFSKMLELQ